MTLHHHSAGESLLYLRPLASLAVRIPSPTTAVPPDGGAGGVTPQQAQGRLSLLSLCLLSPSLSSGTDWPHVNAGY